MGGRGALFGIVLCSHLILFPAAEMLSGMLAAISALDDMGAGGVGGLKSDWLDFWGERGALCPIWDRLEAL